MSLLFRFPLDVSLLLSWISKPKWLFHMEAYRSKVSFLHITTVNPPY